VRTNWNFERGWRLLPVFPAAVFQQSFLEAAPTLTYPSQYGQPEAQRKA
jgi:hypothetical protein